MKGIYLTQEGKQEIEAKIAELELISANDLLENLERDLAEGNIEAYKKILKSATILPVEETWINVSTNAVKRMIEDFTNKVDKKEGSTLFDVLYPQGVIIQPKQ